MDGRVCTIDDFLDRQTLLMGYLESIICGNLGPLDIEYRERIMIIRGGYVESSLNNTCHAIINSNHHINSNQQRKE